MGGRDVGEFGVDSALSSGKGKGGDEGIVGLGAHGVRVGDVVRVEEIAGGVGKAKGKSDTKNKGADSGRIGAEGVVTRVGERSVWVAFGGREGPGKDDEEGVQELWGKKIWM